MPSMKKLWTRYLFPALFFSFFLNMLYLAIPVYFMVIYDRVLFSYSQASLITISCGAVFAILVMGLLHYMRSRLCLLAGYSLRRDLEEHVLAGMHRDASSPRGRGYTRGMDDLDTVAETLSGPSSQTLLDLPWIPVLLAVLFFMSPVLALIGTAGAVLSGLLYFLLHKLTRNRRSAADTVFAQGRRFIDSSLAHAEMVAGMGMLGDLYRGWRGMSSKAAHLRYEAGAYMGSISGSMRSIHSIVLLGVYGTGAYLFFSQQISVGVMFAAAVLAARILLPLNRAVFALRRLQDALAARKRLKHFIPAGEGEKTLSLPAPQGKVDLEGATLAVGGRQVLRNIAFSLEAGETLGVLGPSGAGKSSLLKLLLGIWSPAGGTVRLDGADISHWDREELGPNLGYLPQENALFPGTVKENIARLAEIDPERVVRAGQRAGVHEAILHLPDGYDTEIYHSAKNLPAGQRQLIAFARALYTDPALVLLDEPEAHLDEAGLRSLHHMLANLKSEGTSVVLVSDKPHLLQKTDKLLVLKQGQVALFGPSGEVMNQLKAQQQPQQSGSAGSEQPFG